jgi:peptidoglycan/xylan/chitin deacetylase (PgdA/CDA1 family)
MSVTSSQRALSFFISIAAGAVLASGGMVEAMPATKAAAERPTVKLRLVEPAMRLAASGGQPGRVALTLDACGGSADLRILDALAENRIPATVFVTGTWLRRNKNAMALMLSHPDLFELEDHGARHLPAVDFPDRIYGLKAAGSQEAVENEVREGALDLQTAGGGTAHWYRGATARYSPSALELIHRLGFRVAGFSINADGGAMFGAALTERNVTRARDGDVIIAHVNQPSRSAGAGLVRGLLDLKAKGVRFVRLEDAPEIGTTGS